VAAGGAGEVCVVWSDLRNGNADLYFRAVDDQSGVAADDRGRAWTSGVALGVPYPNPSASCMRVDFALARETYASVEVFDIEGRLVAILARGFYGAGSHPIRWEGLTREGTRTAPGIYFIRCKSPIGEDVKRVVIAR
jgi:hypothetical protein